MGSLVASELGLEPLLASLGLACRQYSEDSGVWLLLVRWGGGALYGQVSQDGNLPALCHF